MQRYDFRRVSKEDIVINLKKIAKEEKLEIDDSSLTNCLKRRGGHRDAIVLLEKFPRWEKIDKNPVEVCWV